MTGTRQVEEFINYLRYERRYSPHTLVAYQGDLKQFRSFLEDQYQIENWNEVQMLHIRSWVYDMAEHLMDRKTINRKISSLRSFYQFMLREGIVLSNPVLSVQSMKTASHLPEVLPEKTLKNYFQFSDRNTWKDVRDRMLIALLYETGMRRAELIELRWLDVHLKAGMVLVMGKRQKQRQIPIRPQLADQMREYRGLTSDEFGVRPEYIMLTDSGKKVYPKWIYNRVKNILGNWAQHQQISPHVLRHSIATHLLDAGADIQVIRELLGHSSLAATQIYTHNSIEKLKQSYRKALPDLDGDFH